MTSRVELYLKGLLCIYSQRRQRFGSIAEPWWGDGNHHSSAEACSRWGARCPTPERSRSCQGLQAQELAELVRLKMKSTDQRRVLAPSDFVMGQETDGRQEEGLLAQQQGGRGPKEAQQQTEKDSQKTGRKQAQDPGRVAPGLAKARGWARRGGQRRGGRGTRKEGRGVWAVLASRPTTHLRLKGD